MLHGLYTGTSLPPSHYTGTLHSYIAHPQVRLCPRHYIGTIPSLCAGTLLASLVSDVLPSRRWCWFRCLESTTLCSWVCPTTSAPRRNWSSSITRCSSTPSRCVELWHCWSWEWYQHSVKSLVWRTGATQAAVGHRPDDDFTRLKATFALCFQNLLIQGFKEGFFLYIKK